MALDRLIRVLIVTLALGAITFLSACGGHGGDSDNHNHEGHLNQDEIEQDVDFHKHSIIDNRLWEFTDLEDDPLSELQPEVVDCPKAAWGFENGTLEVQTGVCNYFSASQETRVVLNAGQNLQVIVYHADLIADEPAEGYVAILVNDTIIWEKTVSIPSDAANYDEIVASPVDIEASDIITFHLQNHGFNSWNLLIIRPAEGEEHHHVEE